MRLTAQDKMLSIDGRDVRGLDTPTVGDLLKVRRAPCLPTCWINSFPVDVCFVLRGVTVSMPWGFSFRTPHATPTLSLAITSSGD
jgi:hypothetical protein